MSQYVCPGYGSSVFRYSEHGVADAVLEYDPDRSTSQKHFRRRFAYSSRTPQYELRAIMRGVARLCKRGRRWGRLDVVTEHRLVQDQSADR